MTKKKSQTKRNLLLLLVLAGLLGLAALASKLSDGAGFGGREATAVETATAAVETITEVVTASGRVQPTTVVAITPDVSGEVVALYVREGDPVRAGQLLARIRSDFYKAQVEQADAHVLERKAAREQHHADLLHAQSEWERHQYLFEKKAISESAYQQARTRYLVAKSAHKGTEYGVQSAEARARELRGTMNKTMIYAPIDGTVSLLNVEQGERVVATGQFAGTEMMRIAHLDRMEIEIDINENDVINVVQGDTAQVHVDAYPDQPFRGVVTEIANSARIRGRGTQEQITNFPVKVRILDPHNADLAPPPPPMRLNPNEPYTTGRETPVLRPGMSGSVDIYTATALAAITVPIQSVTVRDFNRDQPAAAGTPTAKAGEDLRKVVFTVVDGEARMTEVETGIADETHIEIKRGLAGAETVIIGPYNAVSRLLHGGDLVRSTPADVQAAQPRVAKIF